MRFSHRQKHMVDLLFPVALFFVFTLLAVTVVLMATQVYQKTTDESQLNHTAQTSLSYLQEKIRQADADGQVQLTTLAGQDALCLSRKLQDAVYTTYIYVWDGSLRELFAKEDAAFPLDAGEKILDVTDFSMEEVGNGLYRFSCTAADGNTAQIVVAVHSSLSSDEDE